MRGAQLFLVLLVQVTMMVGAAGCGAREPEQEEGATEAEGAPTATAATADTATEVALYGLISWADSTDASGHPTLVALMPNTTAPPRCIKKVPTTNLERHHPVLKIVTGTPDWGTDVPLDALPGTTGIFSLAGWQVSFENTSHHALSKQLDLLASNAVLNALRLRTLPTQPPVGLDAALLDAALPTKETRLASRVVFTHGQATAKASAYCAGEPKKYLAETSAAPQCPYNQDIVAKQLADEVVVRLRETGAALRIHFSKWTSPVESRIVTVNPSTSGGGVRVEIAHQHEMAAKELDTRNFCGHNTDLRDYLWYYDLSPNQDCPDHPLFPCPAKAGGTKCPQNDGGG